MDGPMKNCDMCGSPIKEGKCSCGEWTDPDSLSDAQKAFRDALTAFHKMERMAITADAPHLGVAVVFFRGDYTDCLDVQDYIQKRKGRPYYEE